MQLLIKLLSEQFGQPESDDLSRADEGEVGWVEKDNQVLALAK